MRPRWNRAGLVGVGALACWLLLAPAASAQAPLPGSMLPNPRLFTLNPCGGRIGTTVEVTFTGTDLEEPETLIFSHPGIKAEPIVPPASPAAKPPANATAAKAPAPAAPPAKPVISKFKVSISPGTPPGFHDARLVNKWGVSNPRVFVAGDLNEVAEREPNNDVPEAQRLPLNTTVNGVIAAPTDVDYYVFAGKKGQRVVTSCLASSIDSRLEAGVELYDNVGRRLAANRNYAGGDALADCTLPADGDYFVRVFEFTHAFGDAEHFYRLTISTAPWIDAVLPPMVEPGKTAAVTVFGRNLPGGKPDPSAKVAGRALETLTMTVDAPKDPASLHRLAYDGHVGPAASALDGFEFRLRNEVGVSNPHLLTFARAPVVLDNGGNDTPETAQPVTLPCEIAGRIEKRRDRDWYAFEAKKGTVHDIELFSERLGAPTDLALTLHNFPAKQALSDLDDTTDALNPFKFFTPTRDPARLRFTAPADGKYVLLVRSHDAERRFGPRHLYRLRITPVQPDFRLIVMPPDDQRPDSCRLLRGGSQSYTVLVWREGDFNGSITLAVEGLPPGVSCPPQTVGPELTQVPLVLNAAADAPTGIHEIKVKGTATINGQSVVRQARPASITWPIQPGQILPVLSRLDHALMLAVKDQAPFHLAATIDKPMVMQGDKPNVTLKLKRIWPDFKTPLQVQPLDLPKVRNQPVMNIPNATIAPGKDEAKVVIDVRPNTAPGTYNLAFRADCQIPYNKDPKAKEKPNTNVVLASTPLALTVIPKQLATVKLPAPAITAKPGTQTEVVVQLARMHAFAGEFKVKLVLPPNLKGLDAPEAVIPAGKDDTKLMLKVAADAPIGNHANLVVQATALYDGKVSITQEAKLAVNVIKGN